MSIRPKKKSYMSLPINTNTSKKKNIQGHMAAMRLGVLPKVLNSHVTAISIFFLKPTHC